MKFYNFFLIINNKMKFELLELLYLNQMKTNEKQTVRRLQLPILIQEKSLRSSQMTMLEGHRSHFSVLHVCHFFNRLFQMNCQDLAKSMVTNQPLIQTESLHTKHLKASFGTRMGDTKFPFFFFFFTRNLCLHSQAVTHFIPDCL